MTVSAIGSTPPVSAQSSAASVVSSNAKAADGDYLAAGPGRSSVKDSDGDYKPTQTSSAATSSPAATSSSNVQAALSNLKLGG